MSKARVRPTPDWIDQAGAGLTLVLGLVFLVFDAAMIPLGLSPGSADIFGVFLLINAAAIVIGSRALSLKFRGRYWPTVGIGAAISVAAICIGTSGYAAWQLIEQDGRFGGLILALPGGVLVRGALRLLSEDRGLKSEDLDTSESDEGPKGGRVRSGFVGAMFSLGRYAINLIVWANVLLLVGYWALWTAVALPRILTAEAGFSLVQFGQYLVEIRSEVFEAYFTAAWPLTQGVLILMVVLVPLILVILTPLGWLLKRGAEARLDQIDDLSDAQLDWLEDAETRVLAWVETHRDRVLAIPLMIGVFLGLAGLFGIVGWGVSWAIASGLSDLLNPVAVSWHVDGLSFWGQFL